MVLKFYYVPKDNLRKRTTSIRLWMPYLPKHLAYRQICRTRICVPLFLFLILQGICRHKFHNHPQSQNGYATESMSTVLIISTKIILFSSELLRLFTWHHGMENITNLNEKVAKVNKTFCTGKFHNQPKS